MQKWDGWKFILQFDPPDLAVENGQVFWLWLLRKLDSEDPVHDL